MSALPTGVLHIALCFFLRVLALDSRVCRCSESRSNSSNENPYWQPFSGRVCLESPPALRRYHLVKVRHLLGEKDSLFLELLLAGRYAVVRSKNDGHYQLPIPSSF